MANRVRTKRRYRSLSLRKRQRRRRMVGLVGLVLFAIASFTLLLEGTNAIRQHLAARSTIGSAEVSALASVDGTKAQLLAAGERPSLVPPSQPAEVWECEVAVVGGSLGGIAAAAHAMRSGATTCLLELTPWLGGQISSQGVSALDESRAMRARDNFSPSWEAFKRLLRNQRVSLPSWTGMDAVGQVENLNSCWVGELCFSPRAGAAASEVWLRAALEYAPESRWATSTAFKGVAFDSPGRNVTAVYGVKRIPKRQNYAPQGRLSRELDRWYGWFEDDTYYKVPLRLQPPAGGRMIVIDATDTGELVAWARLPHRLGSDAQSVTGEVNAPPKDNTDCTQAYTYPFILATLSDRKSSLKRLRQVEPVFPKSEHRRFFDLEGFPFFHRGGVFNYRRIVSHRPGPGRANITRPGEMTLINWNRGNDWHLMDPPLLYTEDDIVLDGQRRDWRGGLSLESLAQGETHALLFAEWLMETQGTEKLPLAFVSGPTAPMGTFSGLSMVPYLREGRRILGRPAYGQENFMIVESDLREDMTGGRDFSATAVALAHYDIDIHGCRYRDEERDSYEASSASIKEFVVRPLQIPLEALVPQAVDNVLIGGKALAVSHIVNGVTRVHYGEWSVGAAAGATAGWLLHHGQPADMTPSQVIDTGQIPNLQQFLMEEGLRFTW